MLKLHLLALASASLFVPFAVRAQFADSVVFYNAGSGVNPSYTDPTKSLGGPTIFIGYQDADPFNPPYSSSDLVSVGAGGSLTVQFNTPILNSPGNPFGLDFLIFGNAGFVITNNDYTGGGITDGLLLGGSAGSTRVYVSADNANYFLLNPLLAPVVDGFYPADAAGDPTRPVNPALIGADFAGKDINGIRSLYAGSGGGTGFDISWAQDGNGQGVFLPSISFIRVDVLGDKSEIDAFGAVPEPGSMALLSLGTIVFCWTRRRRV